MFWNQFPKISGTRLTINKKSDEKLVEERLTSRAKSYKGLVDEIKKKHGRKEAKAFHEVSINPKNKK